MTREVIAQNHNSTAAIFDDILARLHSDEKLGKYLNRHSIKDESEWMFNNAGGERRFLWHTEWNDDRRARRSDGSMYIIHASVTEVRGQ